MKRPLLIDLFCGEGGAAMGYSQAGFDVIGIDAKPQPNYPFAFIRENVLSVDPRLLLLADAIHASPPCQFGTELNSDRSRHINLIPATRAILIGSKKPFIIENVRAVRPHLQNPVSLFGFMFDDHCVTSTGQRFELSRERLFETNWPLFEPSNPRAELEAPVANVFGGHLRVRSGVWRTGKGTGRTVDLPGENRRALARKLMGMPWASMKGMSEAVPPSYTRYVGERLLEHLRG